MSRYSDYQKKLEPWVKAKNFLRRHAVILIVGASAAICAATALTSTKGIVSDTQVVSERITYGEALSYGSSVFMGSASYEFSPADEESWSSVVPSDVGNYKMRAKGSNSFGGSYYGATHYFTIDPYATTCELASTTYTYGSKPGVKVELKDGDKVAEYDVAYDDISKDKPIATVQNLKIENSSGSDVTSNYAITYASSEVTFNKLSVSIDFGTETFTYDGSSHSLGDEDYSLSKNLAEGDKLQFEKDAIINAGTNVAVKDGSVKVIHDGGLDVTKHYDLRLSYGTLVVDPAPVTLASVDVSKEYDGKPFDAESYSSLSEKTGLIGGDDVSPVFEDHSTNITPGTYLNNFTYTFTPAEAEPNYKVSQRSGSLTITKRALAISITGVHDYLGTDYAGILPGEEITITKGSLVEGHKLTCYVENETSCVDSVPEVLLKVEDAEGNDVTDCYEFDVDSKALRYAPRKLVVTASDISVEYDGQPHVGEYSVEGLLDGDYVEFEKDENAPAEGYAPAYTNVIKTTYKPSVKAIYSAEGKDRTKYYDVECIEGSFQIYKRHLSVYFEFSRDYYTLGTAIEDALTEGEYTFLEDTNLAEGHNLVITPSEIYSEDPKFNLSITDAEGKSVTSNYDYQLTQGSVSFNKSTLLFNGLDVTCTYDGYPHGVTPNISGLRDDDWILWARETTSEGDKSYDPSNDQNKATKVGTYVYEFKIDKIYNRLGVDVSKHYVYNESYEAHLTIEKASPVTVNLITKRDYDGTEYVPTLGTDYRVSGLAALDSATISMNEDIFLNPSSTNFDVTIMNSALNEEVSDCYSAVNKQNAKNITWKKGELSVEAVSESIEYSGLSTRAHISISGLASHDMVTFKLNGQTYSTSQSYYYCPLSNTEPGTYPLDVEIVGVSHQSNWKKDWTTTENYYSGFKAVSGTLTITPRSVRISILEHGSSPKNYYHPYCYSMDSGSLASGHRIRFNYVSNGSKVDYVPYVLDYDNSDVTRYYNITVNGRSTFSRIFLKARYKTTSIVYDGQSHTGVPEVTGIPDGCSATIVFNENPDEYKAKYVGDVVTYTPSIKSIKDAEGIDETALYEVAVYPGTLSIVQRPIHVSISGEKTYNGSLFSSSELIQNKDFVITDSSEDSGLASGDYLSIVPIDDGTGSIIGASDENDFNIAIFSSDGEDRTANYDLHLDINYTFKKADLEVSAKSESFSYDGKAHKGGAGGVKTQGSDKATIDDTSNEETEVGKYDYSLTVTSVTSADGEDRSAYYNFDSASKSTSFNINKGKVTISFPTRTIFSGGNAIDLNAELEDFASKIDVDGLPDGFSLNDSPYSFKPGPSDPGNYNFSDYLETDKIKILNSNGEDKTENFDIEIKGNFVIKDKIAVNLRFIDASKTYDGKAFSANDLRYTTNKLPSDIKLMCSVEKKVPSDIDKGTYSVDPEMVLATNFYLVYADTGERLDQSAYTINVTHEPTFTIKPCAITFETPTIIDFFFGEELTVPCGDATVISCSSSYRKLGDNRFSCNNGEIITLTPSHATYTFSGASSEGDVYPNGADTDSERWTAVVTRDGIDVTYNYDISFVYGTITVYEF